MIGVRVRLDSTPYSTVALCRVVLSDDGRGTCSWRAVTTTDGDAVRAWAAHAREAHAFVGEVPEGAARVSRHYEVEAPKVPAVCGAPLAEGGVCDRPVKCSGRCARCLRRAQRARARAAQGVGVGVGALVGAGVGA